MIKSDDILDKTNKGLDIIRHLYPDAGRVIDSGNMKQPFKTKDERTPSAHLKQYDLCWVVTDFGDDQRGHNPISLWMKEKGLGYAESLLDINAELGLGLGNIIQEGKFFFEFNEYITAEELRHICPLGSRKGVESLHWHSVKMIAFRGSDGRYAIRMPKEDSPTFMRECRYIENGELKKFYEKYEPMSQDILCRFSIIGKRPYHYINGLYELKEDWSKWNKTGIKFGDVFLCKNELFALKVRSFGRIALWLDSETAMFNASDFKEIRKYAKRLYIIPSWIEMDPMAYVQLEGIKPVLSDSEEGD